MLRLEVITHRDISQEELLGIIKIKQVSWNYPIESQMLWIERNLSEEDIHCILKEESIPIAYLNLKDISVTIDGADYMAYGIGNVCSKIKGCGYGSELILKVNNYLLDSKRVGLLFCKDKLVDFYSRFNWILIQKDRLLINQELNTINTMCFNSPARLQFLEYKGILF